MYIARTKMTPSSLPVGFVHRPELLEVLDRGDDRALTLISAPAGFGKSLLLADWIRSRPGTPTAWLTLEPDDTDPRRFWAAVLAALVRCPGVPQTAGCTGWSCRARRSSSTSSPTSSTPWMRYLAASV